MSTSPARRRTFILFGLAAASAFAARGAVADTKDLVTLVRAGETVNEEIIPAGDVDEFGIQLFPGDKLQVRVKGAGPVVGLKSVIALFAPDSLPTPAVVSANDSAKPSLKFTAQQAGVHVLRIVGHEGQFLGSVGNYLVTFVVQRAKPAAAVFTAGASSGAIAYRFAATDGAKVTLKATTKKGGFTLTGLLRPDGSPEPDFAAKLKASKNRRSATAAKLLLTGGAGTYELDGTFDAGSSVKTSVSVTHAEKAKSRRLFAEPTFDVTNPPSPPSGIEGTMMLVSGSDFLYLLNDPDNPDDDTYPRFFFGTVEVPRATIQRPNGALYLFPVPAGLTPGVTYDITVLNADGQGATSKNAFNYAVLPTITSFAPTEAGPAGGRKVRITGTDFHSGTLVLFGDKVVQPTLTLSTRIDVTAPARPAGTLALSIRDEFGRTVVAPQGFTYLNIGSNRISVIDHAFLQALGGETVNLTGADFVPSSVFTLDGTDVAATQQSSSQASFTAPVHAHGTAVLRVTDQYDQTSTLNVTVKGFSDDTATDVPAVVTTTNGLDGWRATRVLTGDVSGDGIPDLVLLQAARAFGTTAQRTRVRVLRGSATGVFSDVTTTSIAAVFGDEDWRARDGVLTDLDGNGSLDLALITDGDVLSPLGTAISSLRLLKNNGAGVFTDQTATWAPAGTTWGDRNQGVAIAAANVDGATGNDLVIVNTTAYSETIVTVTDPGNPGAIPPIPPTMVTTTTYYPALRVLKNDGTGKLTRTLAAVPTVLGTDAQQYEGDAIAVGDVDGDTDIDIVITRDLVTEKPAGTYHRTARLLKNAAGTFTDASATSLPSVLQIPEYMQGDRVLLANVTGDSALDLILVSNAPLTNPATGAQSTGPALRVFVNSGGAFSASTDTFPAKSGSDVLQGDSVAVGDLDGDGSQDMVVVSTAPPDAGDHACRILRKSGATWVVATIAMPTPGVSDDGHGEDVRLVDTDGDGDLDIVVVRNDSNESVQSTRIFVNPRK
ncbi:MAG: FG-GAP-like repeat-containing protein [Planctomycetes bacterium]|nr:FG-GAP-like repeat-containing protein [Planctomycetota bacterium]